MSNDLSSTDRQPDAGTPGPGFVPPAPPSVPAAYGAQPQPPQPQTPPPSQRPVLDQPVEQHWTPEGLVAVPALPPERVGHGALLALLAIPVGVVLTAVIWKLGFVASISGIVVSAGAAVLYARGSGGRVKKGIPVVLAVAAVGIAASFLAAVAVDLYDVFPQLDPELSATYPSRGSFVTHNLCYPPVLKEYVRTGVLLVVFGVVGAFGTIVRLVRVNATLER
ncbi:MAG: hypothetical protein ACRYG2_13085 [Janthinobacterium lividum]